MVSLLIEPVHEMLLQPVEGLPLGGASVREAEVAEHSLEVVLVEIADVPEHGLVAPVAGRHIHRVDDLLEVVVDYLDKGPLLHVQLHHVIQVVKVVVAVVLADEVIHIHKELGGGDSSHKLG